MEYNKRMPTVWAMPGGVGFFCTQMYKKRAQAGFHKEEKT